MTMRLYEVLSFFAGHAQVLLLGQESEYCQSMWWTYYLAVLVLISDSATMAHHSYIVPIVFERCAQSTESCGYIFSKCR